MPVCRKYGIRMYYHPDDPAWPVFGLPRIAGGKEGLLRILRAVDDEHSGVTLCTGSLGSQPETTFRISSARWGSASISPIYATCATQRPAG